MAAIIESWFEQDLKKPVQVQVLNGNVFSQDHNGNLVGVKVYDGGEPAALTGSVNAYCILADGTTVPVDGTRQDNMAYIMVPQSALAVPGTIRIVIKLTEVDGNDDVTNVTTLAAIVSTVYRTKTDTVITPSSQVISDWSQDIAAEIQNCADARASLGTIIAEEYSTTKTYAVGEYVMKSGTLYRCTTAVTTAGSWSSNSSKFTAVKLGADVCDLKSALSYDESLINQGFYTIQKTDLELGGWDHGKKTTPNPMNRIRAKILFPIRAGSVIAYSNTTYQVFFSVVDASGTNVQSISWKSDASGSITITADGFLTLMIRKPNSPVLSESDIEAFDSVVTIQTFNCVEFADLLENSLLNRGTLTSSDDLNSIALSGAYYFEAGSRPAHSPVTTGGRLFVIKSFKNTANHSYEWQIVITKAGTYVRAHSNAQNNGFGEWETLVTESEFSAIMARINDAIYYAVDPSQLTFSFGGINSDGKSNTNTKRIRYYGAIKVGAGSTITPVEGYKFNVALYSSYISFDNFELIDYVSVRTTAYTVSQDCYIRIGIGTVNEDELWETDEEELKTYTAAGEAAKSGLILNLISGTVKTEIENIREMIESKAENVIPLETEIPLNAIAYHQLYDDLVAEGLSTGFFTRTLLGYQDNDTDYPIYQYVIRNDMDHLASNYSIVRWDGSNGAYQRPKIFLDSGVHGSERTTPYALWDFINKLCTDIKYQRIRNAFDWYIIPLVNPWGFSHTSFRKSTGRMDSGGGYTEGHTDEFDVIENTSTYHQGIRCNKQGIDINRDFQALRTDAAQMFRDAVTAMTADERDFIFAIDAHQAAKGDNVNAIGAFLSLYYGAPAEKKNYIYNKFMQAGAIVEQAMAEYCDVKKVQSIFPWDAQNTLTTIKQFMSGYTDYSMTFEGGENCVYYSGSKEYSNPIARTFVNTAYHHFLLVLTEKWLSE